MKNVLPALLAFSCAFFPIGVDAEPIQQKSFTKTSRQDLKTIARLHHHARAALLNKDFRKAVRLYQEILLLEPDDETAYARLGQVYSILGDFERAREAFYNALHINPENEAALEGLDRIENPDAPA